MLIKIKQSLLSIILLSGIALSFLSLSYAATPNPGHPWSGVGDGNFAVTGQTAPRTYTLPDASTTILTTNSLVSVAQGGTGSSSLTGVLIGNGTSAVTATTSPDGLLVGTSAAQTLINKVVDLANNIITDVGTVAGDLLKSNGTKFIRFATTTPLSYVRVNDAGTDLEWSAVGGLTGSDTQLLYNSGGSSWGATSSLSISADVLYVDSNLSLATSTLPSSPATGTLSLFNSKVSGRDMISFRSSSSDDYSTFQSNIFDNYSCMIKPSGGSTTSNFGCAVGGSFSVAGNEISGFHSRHTFSATASSFSTSETMFLRGTSATGQNGFFYFARTLLPDADYSNSSGVRMIYGLSDQTSANSICGSDNVTGQDLIAFSYSTALSSNWRIAADDGTGSAPTYTDTGVAFTVSTTYDMYIYSPPYPDHSVIYWRLDDVTNGTTVEGTASTQLPAASVLLGLVACFDSVNAVTRNYRMEIVYGEVPR